MTRSTIYGVANVTELSDLLHIAEPSDQLDRFLLNAVNFVNGKTRLDVCDSDGTVEPSQIPLFGRVIDYAIALVDQYDGQNPFDIFSKTLNASVHLPDNNKSSFIQGFIEFVGSEKTTKLAYTNTGMGAKFQSVLLKVGSDILPFLIGEYNTRFERLAQAGITPGNKQYVELQSHYAQDLTTLLKKTEAALKLNAEFNLDHSGINYRDWFPAGRYEGFGIELVKRAVESNDPGLLISNGVLAVKHGGPRGERRDDIVLYYGDAAAPNTLKLEYPGGLGRKGLSFYYSLSSMCSPPTPDLKHINDKTRAGLGS